MTDETSIRVRVVRCPKCSQRLVELPDFTLYNCGGCGTTLQAKNWKTEAHSNGSQINGTTDPPGLKDGQEDCSVELCLDTTVFDSQSGSPEVKSNRNDVEESKDSPLGGYEDLDYKLDDDKDTYNGSPSSLTSCDLGSSRPRGIYENSVNSRLSSQSSPIDESHVSLYITSHDVDNLNQSLVTSSFRRFSSSGTLGSSAIAHGSDRNVRDFSKYPNGGTYHTYYGSDSSYNGNEDHSFQHPSLSRKSKHQWAHVNGSMMRLDEERGGSVLPFALSSRGIVHRLRSPLSSHRNSLPPRPSSRPLLDPSCSEPDKIDLIRTVDELKAQLRSMQLFKNNINHSGACHIRGEEAISWGEPCRAHIRNSCSCCHPQEHRYSAQLPSSFMRHCKNGHCMVRTSHSCCGISSSLGPPQCKSSGHGSSGGWFETTSDQRKYREYETKRLHLQDKRNNSPKKHLLPLAGGAPFVTCYHCLELLKLPADFIAFDRRHHRLTCSSCKKVLKFSLVKGTKIVRHLLNASAQPPSEAGGYSQDHDRSFFRSCSADSSESEDQSSQIRKILSGSCNDAVENRKMKSISRDSKNKNEGMPETVESFVPSSKVPRNRKTTLEIEERVKSSNSPLHTLMGYSSPRLVLNN